MDRIISSRPGFYKSFLLVPCKVEYQIHLCLTFNYEEKNQTTNKEKNSRPKECCNELFCEAIFNLVKAVWGVQAKKNQNNLFVLYEYLYIIYKSVIYTNEYLVFQQDEGCKECSTFI